jgi:uncharacterized membrane protein YfcA
MHTNVIWTCVLLLFTGTLCSAAGIGGGGVYVVLLMLINGLDPADAVPLSKSVIFSGAVAYSASMWAYEHLYAPRRGVQVKNTTDGVVISLVVPMTLCGTSVGVFVNAFAPGVVILAGLCGVLLMMSGFIAWQAFKQRVEEDAEFASIAGTSSSRASPQDPDHEASIGVPLMDDVVEKQSVEAVTMYDMLTYNSLLVLMVICNISHFRYESCVDNGNAADCARFPMRFFGKSTAVWVPMLLPLWLSSGLALVNSVHAHRNRGWSVVHLAGYLSVAFFTGVAAGLVGVGGGLIFSPFFVIMGIDPAVAVGTSSFCVFFTSASTTFSYLFTDRIITTLALVFGLAVLPASFAGVALLQYLQTIRRSKSTIMIVVALGVIASLFCTTLKLGFTIQNGGASGPIH